jgi:hypothetical protein
MRIEVSTRLEQVGRRQDATEAENLSHSPQASAWGRARLNRRNRFNGLSDFHRELLMSAGFAQKVEITNVLACEAGESIKPGASAPGQRNATD